MCIVTMSTEGPGAHTPVALLPDPFEKSQKTTFVKSPGADTGPRNVLFTLLELKYNSEVIK